MDLARVYVGPQNITSMLVPYSWSTWTYQGIRFRRRGDVIQQECGEEVWMLPEVTHVGLGEESREND